MQRQTNMLNLFVEFGFQLFNMKTLFYFQLRISAGMINNLKTRNITLILTPFRSTEVLENVGVFVPKEMLINTCVKMLRKIRLWKGPELFLSFLKYKSCHSPVGSTASSFETHQLIIIISRLSPSLSSSLLLS